MTVTYNPPTTGVWWWFFYLPKHIRNNIHVHTLIAPDPLHCAKLAQCLPNMPDMSGTILKCPAESSSTARHFALQWSMWRKCPGKKTKFAGHFQIAKCPTGNQNVWQSTECLPDILSGTPEIILGITASLEGSYPIYFKLLAIELISWSLWLFLIELFVSIRISYNFILVTLSFQIQSLIGL